VLPPPLQSNSAEARLPESSAHMGEGGGGGLLSSFASLMSRIPFFGPPAAAKPVELPEPKHSPQSSPPPPSQRPKWDDRTQLSPELFDRPHRATALRCGAVQGESDSSQRKLHTWRSRWEAKHLEHEFWDGLSSIAPTLSPPSRVRMGSGVEVNIQTLTTIHALIDEGRGWK